MVVVGRLVCTGYKVWFDSVGFFFFFGSKNRLVVAAAVGGFFFLFYLGGSLGLCGSCFFPLGGCSMILGW